MSDVKFPPELQSLLASYRASLPDQEPSADFTPRLWASIDARRGWSYGFGRLAARFVTAAAAICLALGLMLPPLQNGSPVVSNYVDVLADSGADDMDDEIGDVETI